MVVFKPPKRTWEREYYGFDFATTRSLPVGVTVADCEFSLSVIEGEDPDPNAMVSGSSACSGTIAKTLLIDGVSGTQYMLHGRATMSDGQKLEECGTFWVRDCDDEVVA